MSSYLQTKQPRSRSAHVPAEANWGQAYTIYRRQGMDHADAAYRADERQRRIDRADDNACGRCGATPSHCVCLKPAEND